MDSYAYELAGPNVVSEQFQEGLVILNMETGIYFDAGDRLVPMLEAITDGLSMQALQDALDAREPGTAAQALAAIAKMLEFGLLRQVPARTQEVSPALIDAIFAAGPTFHLESHADLAELIAADPVHDVDAGTGRLMTK